MIRRSNDEIAYRSALRVVNFSIDGATETTSVLMDRIEAVMGRIALPDGGPNAQRLVGAWALVDALRTMLSELEADTAAGGNVGAAGSLHTSSSKEGET